MNLFRFTLMLSLLSCRSLLSNTSALSPAEQAQVLLARGDGAAALPILESLQNTNPGDLLVARQVAEAHVKAGSGMAFLERLSTVDSAVARYQEGLVRFSLPAEAGERALDAFRKAVQLRPDEPEFRFRLGIALLESEQFEASLAELELANKPQSSPRPSWQLPLAKARFHSGDSKGAVSALRAFVEGNPLAHEVTTARALMAQISDPFAQFPKSARTQLEQAMSWLDSGDQPQQAIVVLEEVLREHPDAAIVHALLGLSWARIDDAGKAIEELKRAVELSPDDGKYHLYLAEIYEARQRQQTADSHFSKAVELNPLLDGAWVKLGDSALHQQDYPKARSLFLVAARLDTQNFAARGKLALVYQLEGNWPAADHELRGIHELAPQNLEFILRLGILHTERYLKGKNVAEKQQAQVEARIWLQKVLDAQPENAIASRALERLSQHDRK
jgi:Flp pilus assembly protein TadD